ncbi:hypothetical protein AB0K18_25895 [Nonomuraea sp. NPDC049421]|uniref:hypothetical protein n=1 Tax=Nonomuraea sp. NPDC049421 TaxID=3155275 RepID=UPI00344AB6F9
MEKTCNPRSSIRRPRKRAARPWRPCSRRTACRWCGWRSCCSATGRALRTWLPKDPQRLKEELLRRDGELLSSTGDRGAGRQPSEQDTLWWMGQALLMDMPAPPAVRAAALRMMAALPGARVEDEAADAEGRTGLAIVRRSDRDPLELRLVLDRSSGEVLGTTARVTEPLPATSGLDVGDLRYARVVEAIGWTGGGPRLPDGCVQRPGETCQGS